MKIETEYLSATENQEILRLLQTSNHNPPSVEDIWAMMDQVWDELECDNQNLDNDKILTYYQHPVWILNGIFVDEDEESLRHRQVISHWISRHHLDRVLDYGGGMGTLACLIAQDNPSAMVEVYEPFPSRYAQQKIQAYPNVQFTAHPEAPYDCLVSTDVLEHVDDPLALFAKMIGLVKLDGYLIIANHFYPSIKCHLPCTFHLRFTFKFFAQLMGLKKLGMCDGIHAAIYQKQVEKELNWNLIRKLESFSKVLFASYQALQKMQGKSESIKSRDGVKKSGVQALRPH